MSTSRASRVTIDMRPSDKLRWEGLSLSVPEQGIGSRWRCSRKPAARKVILKGVSGAITPGETMALMGPSGSGKTSLLSLLAGRLPHGGRMDEGSITMGGVSLTKAFYRRCGFVFQDDLLLPSLTVRETIEFAAKLRLPRSLTEAQKIQRAQATIEQLNLTDCADTTIGSEKKRGVSGGERKRCAVGVELVARPPLLFLDEPTSGLDAATALSLALNLRRFAHEIGMIVISSVHQPRSNIFAIFDQLLLLSKGSTVFFGPAPSAVPFMEEHAKLELPPQTNPADWLIDLIDARAVELVELWQTRGGGGGAGGDGEGPGGGSSSSGGGGGGGGGGDGGGDGDGDGDGSAAVGEATWSVKALRLVGLSSSRALAEATRSGKVVAQVTKASAHEGTSSWYQFRVLLSRSAKQQRGDVYSWINCFQILSVAVIAALIWSGSSNVNDTKGVLFFVNIQQAFNAQNTVLRLFPMERSLMIRERRCGSYRMLPYFLSKSAADSLAIFVLPVLYALIIYFSVGLRLEATAFFWYLLFSLTAVFGGQSVGLLISLAIPDYALANCVSFVVVLFTMLFGGFYVGVDRLPTWLAWIRFTSFLFWAYSGMIINEFGGRQVDCADARPGEYGDVCPFSGDLVIESMGYEDLNLGLCFAMLITVSLLFRVMAYVCLRYEVTFRV